MPVLLRYCGEPNWIIRPCYGDSSQLKNELRQALADQADTQIWGVWHGLFGLAANQLILMTAYSKQVDEWRDLADCEVLSRTVLRPIVRPLSAETLDHPGIYVFRDFWLPGVAIEEAVTLSSAAWQTFEGADSTAPSRWVYLSPPM